MFKDYKEDIDRYFDHFSKEFDQIKSLKCTSSLHFKTLLYCSLIDALSRTIYNNKEPRDRFTSLVKRFGKWKDNTRISLPHLFRLLQLTPDPAFEKLRDYASRKLSVWKAPWINIKICEDPYKDEILKYWPRDNEYRILFKGIKLDSLTHLQLLYKHRNFLVHELRTPGYGIEISNDATPYYHDLLTVNNEIDPPENTFELVYPVLFFENLIDTLIIGTKKYLTNNKLNPYHYYSFGSYWIEDLN